MQNKCTTGTHIAKETHYRHNNAQGMSQLCKYGFPQHGKISIYPHTVQTFQKQKFMTYIQYIKLKTEPIQVLPTKNFHKK